MATTTTRHGETWDMISYRVYGDEHWTWRLVNANRELRHVRLFSAGIKITVPPLPEEAASRNSLPPWKQ